MFTWPMMQKKARCLLQNAIFSSSCATFVLTVLCADQVPFYVHYSCPGECASEFHLIHVHEAHARSAQFRPVHCTVCDFVFWPPVVTNVAGNGMTGPAWRIEPFPDKETLDDLTMLLLTGGGLGPARAYRQPAPTRRPRSAPTAD